MVRRVSDELQTVAADLQRRIEQIDRQLADSDRLRQEREHLARALEEVIAASGTTRPSARRRRDQNASDTGASPQAPPAARRTGRSSRRSGTSKRIRAPQGANRERIVAYLKENGATSASALAKATGINRAVVYNNLTKLTGEGAVVKRDDEGATALFALAD